jgi:hypothetical protein
VQSTQAPGADMYPALPPVYVHAAMLHIGPELPIGCPFGVTYVVTELGTLAADFTFCHCRSSLLVRTQDMIPQCHGFGNLRRDARRWDVGRHASRAY